MTEKSVLSVQELAQQMGISLPKAYELVKEPGFPTIRIGTRILIPTEGFRDWLRQNPAAQHNLLPHYEGKEQTICTISYPVILKSEISSATSK